jgi:hypothetical protein
MIPCASNIACRFGIKMMLKDMNMKIDIKFSILGSALSLFLVGAIVEAQVTEQVRTSLDGDGNVIATDAQGNRRVTVYNPQDGSLNTTTDANGNILIIDGAGNRRSVFNSPVATPMNGNVLYPVSPVSPGMGSNGNGSTNPLQRASRSGPRYALDGTQEMPAQTYASPGSATGDVPERPYKNAFTDSFGSVFGVDQQGRQVVLFANANGLTSDSGFTSAYVDGSGSVWGYNTNGERYLIYDNPRHPRDVSNSGPFVSAVVDEFGDVYGIDDQSSRSIIYQNPNRNIRGTGFVNATVDGAGNVVATDSHGIRRVIYSPDDSSPSTGSVWAP